MQHLLLTSGLIQEKSQQHFLLYFFSHCSDVLRQNRYCVLKFKFTSVAKVDGPPFCPFQRPACLVCLFPRADTPSYLFARADTPFTYLSTVCKTQPRSCSRSISIEKSNQKIEFQFFYFHVKYPSFMATSTLTRYPSLSLKFSSRIIP